MAVVTAVLIQKETGGNLAEIFDRIAQVIRSRFRFGRRVRTLSAEGRLSAWILALVPLVLFGVLWVTSPDYLPPLLARSAGAEADHLRLPDAGGGRSLDAQDHPHRSVTPWTPSLEFFQSLTWHGRPAHHVRRGGGRHGLHARRSGVSLLLICRHGSRATAARPPGGRGRAGAQGRGARAARARARQQVPAADAASTNAARWRRRLHLPGSARRTRCRSSIRSRRRLP